ncbi:MAG: DUF4952 domain-containing protein [Symploca sp. SIO2C1]|nr:DUF4952 domain-containing protein [Symploca sp. SIO2C1]
MLTRLLSSKNVPVMAYWQRKIVIVAMMIFSVSCHSITTKAAHTCEDFLAMWGEKPAELEFTNCKRVELPPGEGLVSSYVVKGSDAAEVEKLLQRKFGMAPLKFLCCGWEPILVVGEDNTSGNGSYVDKDGYSFEVTMHSEETLLNDRKDWPKIPEFHVRVTKYWGI